MHEAFAHDLKVARRKSGLSQQDCGHLLDVDQQHISRLETGRNLPTIVEICSLSLIYGRTFESLFSSVFSDVRERLSGRLGNLPDRKQGWLKQFTRNNSLNHIAARLNDYPN